MSVDVQLNKLFLYARFALNCVDIQVIIYKTRQKCWRSVVIYKRSHFYWALWASRIADICCCGVLSFFIYSCRSYCDKFENCYANACVLLCSWRLGIGEADRTCLAAKIATHPSCIFISVPVFRHTLFFNQLCYWKLVLLKFSALTGAFSCHAVPAYSTGMNMQGQCGAHF